MDATPGLAEGGDKLVHWLAVVHTQHPLTTATTTCSGISVAAEGNGVLVHWVWRRRWNTSYVTLLDACDLRDGMAVQNEAQQRAWAQRNGSYHQTRERVIPTQVDTILCQDQCPELKTTHPIWCGYDVWNHLPGNYVVVDRNLRRGLLHIKLWINGYKFP